MYSKKNIQAYGYTLVELVVVIVVLGVLAAVALPKFVNMATDARKASLEGLKSALISAANMANIKCQFDSSCSLLADGGTFPKTIINGKTIYFHYGYPSGWGKFGVDDGVGSVGDLVNFSGFTYQAHVPFSYKTNFTLNGATDPSNCKVQYQMASSNTPPILVVSVVSSGC